MYAIAKENVALSFDAVLGHTMEHEETLKEIIGATIKALEITD